MKRLGTVLNILSISFLLVGCGGAEFSARRLDLANSRDSGHSTSLNPDTYLQAALDDTAAQGGDQLTDSEIIEVLIEGLERTKAFIASDSHDPIAAAKIVEVIDSQISRLKTDATFQKMMIDAYRGMVKTPDCAKMKEDLNNPSHPQDFRDELEKRINSSCQ